MNPWTQSPQTWTAYGLEWRFEYISLTAKRTITAIGLVRGFSSSPTPNYELLTPNSLDVPLIASVKFPSPQAWLDAWAKKNKKRLPPQREEAVTLELDLFPQPETVQVEIVTDELTPEEERDRLILERQVERAFYQAGKALKELRDRRLYRSTHNTFPEYLKDRFGMKQSRSYQLIDAAKVIENLSSKVPPLVEVSDSTEKVPQFVEVSDSDEKVPQFVEVLPTNEAQCRPLTQLEPFQQREVWQQAVTEAGGKVPSSRIVKDIVQRIRERTKVPNPYRVGDVCELVVKDNPELRGLGGCWCIVTEVREFSCLVHPSKSPLKGETNGLPPFRGELGGWKGEYVVREENLKDLGYSADQQEAVRKLRDRLFQLQSLQDEETAAAILSALGKLKRPYLNPLEEKLLQVLERESVNS